MSRCSLKITIAFITILLTNACKHETHRSFYYWKSIYHLSQSEKRYLEELKISKLYIRFFDVDLDEPSGKAVPIAKIRFANDVLPRYEVVPVVYIVNKTLQKSKHQDITDLAIKILTQVQNIASSKNIAFCELQMDCDWSDNTRSNYFALLEVLETKLHEQGKTLSATIRLHQVKYKNITGVPPVDRGMLMYYNMGKITPNASPNSVFNTTDAAKYIDYLPDYPLTLDVALPAFSWGIHVRNGKVIELLNSMNSSDFENIANFTQIDSSTFTIPKSFFFRGFYFMKNDVVKVEGITPTQCNTAAQQLKSKLSKHAESVAIFHLDSLIISHYEKQDFEKVFSTYH